MIPTWFLVLVAIGVAVMAITMIIQLGVLLGLYFSFRNLQERVQGVMDRQVQPILQSAKSIMDTAQKQADRLAGTLEEFSESARTQLVKIDQLVTEATDRARLQLIRVDEVMADTMHRVEETTEYLQRNVLRPVQEVQAIIHGIRKGLDFMMRGRRNGPDRVTQDEELFI